MTEERLKDLLHESVDGLPPVPLADAAWTDAVRRRRRTRATGVVAAAAAVAVVAGSFALWGGDDRDGDTPPATDPASATQAPTGAPDADAKQGAAPDARHEGWPVYWGPTPAQEATLPWTDSPLPRQIDLSAPATDLADDPLRTALAAYAVTDDDGLRTVLLLASDGTLRRVDVSRVQPLSDEGGNEIVAGASMLSPKGDHLQFPQQGHVLVLTLATGEWRTIDTGSASTEHVVWLGDDLHLPPSATGGAGPLYSVNGERSGSANEGSPTRPPGAGATPYGRSRSGPLGEAQSWEGVPGLPVADGEVTPSQVTVVKGFADRDSALLVQADPTTDGTTTDGATRDKQCCGVQFWLDDEWVAYESRGETTRLIAWKVGTHQLARVAEIAGTSYGEESVVASYARIWS